MVPESRRWPQARTTRLLALPEPQSRRRRMRAPPSASSVQAPAAGAPHAVVGAARREVDVGCAQVPCSDQPLQNRNPQPSEAFQVIVFRVCFGV